MSEILSRCGYRCDLCAARSDDIEVRQKLVDGWKKYLNLQMYTAENVKCEGCYGEKRADTGCPVRPCVIEKGIENCAFCEDFICDKLEPLIGDHDKFKERLPDISDDDYNLCLRQFDSRSRLMEIRNKLSKK